MVTIAQIGSAIALSKTGAGDRRSLSDGNRACPSPIPAENPDGGHRVTHTAWPNSFPEFS
jgi:hypothetical protein